MEQEKIINIEELVQDEHNFNKGTDEGGKLMERSFKEMGAGRSVLIDKHGKIIAGNKSQKAAIAAGIKRVRVIETTGDELIAVKRTDVELESEQGRKMAYLDNLTTQVNLTWDETELEAVQADVEGFDIADFGFDIEDLPQVTFPTGEKQGVGEGNSAEADARDNKERTIHQRDPESEIIVANVSLFGTTEDMMLTQILSKEDADKLIALAKAEGADNLMKRIIAAL